MLGRNYSARNTLEKICPILSGWSANKKLTIRSVDFWIARDPLAKWRSHVIYTLSDWERVRGA